jgi:hypothetical protein
VCSITYGDESARPRALRTASERTNPATILAVLLRWDCVVFNCEAETHLSDRARPRGDAEGRGDDRPGTLLRLSLGQRHRERGPRVGRRTHLNVAAVSKHDRPGDEQAEPDTVPRALPTTASERFKDQRRDIGRNRWASIMNGERHGVAGCRAR